MMAKQPGERYQTPADVVEALAVSVTESVPPPPATNDMPEVPGRVHRLGLSLAPALRHRRARGHAESVSSQAETMPSPKPQSATCLAVPHLPPARFRRKHPAERHRLGAVDRARSPPPPPGPPRLREWLTATAAGPASPSCSCSSWRPEESACWHLASGWTATPSAGPGPEPAGPRHAERPLPLGQC